MTFFETRTAYVVLFAVGFVLYGHTLFFREYTHQDDYHLIVVNYPLISDPAHITKAFVEEAFHERKQGGNIYRPFLTLSLMLDAQLSGTNPLGYRLHNLLLHGFATVLLFVTLTRLNLRREVAFFSALLFAVHPATTQTVVWIPGRNDLLLALFLFLSLLSLLRFKKLPQLRWVFLHGFFFACALFTKETA
ncbi:MAG: glycosyltransferase family 39 protein, partial [Bacteroidota bacterium]